MTEWISVEDRLPDMPTMYMIYATVPCKNEKIKSQQYIALRYFIEFQNRFKKEYEDEKITHWMPLPEPPK